MHIFTKNAKSYQMKIVWYVFMLVINWLKKMFLPQVEKIK